MNELKEFPKFQYSHFIGQDQIVVRCDTIEEFEKAIQDVKDTHNKMFQSTNSKEEQNIDLSIEDTEESHFCKLHNKEMKLRYGEVWDHRSTLNKDFKYDKEGNWYWCQGHGWNLSTKER